MPAPGDLLGKVDLAATAVKQTPLANKWLPAICGALGGLAATGADQVIKQIGKDN